MKKVRFVGLAVILSLLALHCGKQELTRDNAGTLIKSAADFQAPQSVVAVSAPGLSEGQSLGYWDQRGTLSIKGRQFFLEGPRRNTIMLRQPLNRALFEVTGIADAVTPLAGQKGGSIKEAQFNWEYANVPPIPKRIIAKGGTGTAIVRLFDDGWRIDEIRIQSSMEPFSLSPEEEAAAELERKVERERWNSMVRNASTLTKEIYRWTRSRRYPPLQAVFSDVGLEVTITPVFPNYRIVISYADVESIVPSTIPPFIVIKWISRKPLPPSDYYELAQEIDLLFEDQLEQNRAFQIISRAFNEWKSKYPELVGKGELSKAMR